MANPPQAAFCMTCGARLTRELRPDSRKPASVLFSDVEGSTALAERLEPEAMRRVMSRFFDAAYRVCQHHGGTVEKFIGDAVMAVFGIPTAQEDHALRAVRAAVALREAVDQLNVRLERDYGVRLQVRTGVNSGEVVTGDPTGGQALVTGDPVNVAARLEQRAPPGKVLIGEETWRLVGQAIQASALKPFRVKGRDEPVRAWLLVDVTSKIGQLDRPMDAPMLGRDSELGALREEFERVVREAAPRRTTVLGPAGMGKSRLAHELGDALAGEATVLVGRCLPYGEGITYWALAEMLRQAAGDEPRAAIAELLKDDAHGDSIAEQVTNAAGLEEGRVADRDAMWAIRRFFEAFAGARPVVAVFEDIHWAEEPLLDLIEYLTERTQAPLLLLCLARPDLTEQRPDWEKGERVRSIALRPLTERDTRALISGLIAEETVSDEVRAQLVERAEGNPLFVEQMLALVREDPSAERLVVPPTIQALLAARLDRLSVEELAVVGAASVVGQQFWSEAVDVLSPAGGAASVADSLEALVRKELIRPGASTLTGEHGYTFRHGLIRDAAYEALTKESRAELHERFANWAEVRHPERALELEAILGYHLEQAYGYRTELAPSDDRSRALASRAAAKLGSAGRRAARTREDVAAVSLLSRACELLPGAAGERLEYLTLIGDALGGIAKHTKATDVFAEAIEGSVAAGDRAVEGRARLGLAHAWFIADPEKSASQILEEAERAIAILEEVEDDTGLAEALRLVGDTHMYEGRAIAAQQAFENALHHLREDSPPRSWNALLFSMGRCLIDGPVPLERAAGFVQERLELARAQGARSLEADMLHLLGMADGRRGRFEEARRALQVSTAVSEELGLAYMAQWSKQSLGHLELGAGDAEAAERALRSSFEVLSGMGLNSTLGETAVPLADALYQQGRYEEATEILDAVKDEWVSGDAAIEAPRLATRAKLLAVQGWDRHAQRAADRALRVARRTDWACLQSDTLISYAEVLRLAGRQEDALESLHEALDVAQAKGYAVAVRRAQAALDSAADAQRVS